MRCSSARWSEARRWWLDTEGFRDQHERRQLVPAEGCPSRPWSAQYMIRTGKAAGLLVADRLAAAGAVLEDVPSCDARPSSCSGWRPRPAPHEAPGRTDRFVGALTRWVPVAPRETATSRRWSLGVSRPEMAAPATLPLGRCFSHRQRCGADHCLDSSRAVQCPLVHGGFVA